MQISDVYVQNNAAELAKKARQDSVVQNNKKDLPKKAVSEAYSAAANVSISDSGKGSSTEALVKARANALPEIREEKVVIAKERIQSGYYNTPEFSKELSEHLVDG
ncbi:MAG: hypothetical protein LBH25_14260 [Fibromonadaceae bacterium]|jgi:hypothetical protein|nr:hypothetical protein [Fibromonadaceae bacterium]